MIFERIRQKSPVELKISFSTPKNHYALLLFLITIANQILDQQVEPLLFDESSHDLKTARSQPRCSYQLPETDEIVYGVPLVPDEKVRPNSGKRSIMTEQSHYHPARRKKRTRKTRRQVQQLESTTARSILEKEFRPLRIALHFDRQSMDPLPVRKQLFVNSSLLPDAIGFWEQALLVRPTDAPIRLSRKCTSSQYYLDTSAELPYPACVERCKTATNCGEVTVPDAHLFQCRFCAQPNPLTCSASGAPTGPGVSDADFLLYVSTVDSQRCRNEETIAYAAHCQQETELDRPIAGHVNICPGSLSTHSHDQEVLLSTVRHEILHALGFSAGLYAFFRDSRGEPRTKRNRHNRPLLFNRERGYYEADPTTVVRKVHRNWWTAEGLIEHPVYLMVTERVRAEVRKHFNCSELEGAELENQGGDGTALTHWEKRLFENEAMTGTHTQNPVYSRLTLALMEDSGWYRANYSIAEHLHWGHNLGCSFAKKSCGEWIKMRHKKNESAAPFCSDIKHDGHKSLATTRCTDQRDSLALCNLVPYKSPLPMDYRNFATLKGVRREGLPYYGGSVELADFCPYTQEFEWKAVNSTDRRDSRCELQENAPFPVATNSILEVYGPGSRCFDLAINWTEKRCGRLKIYSQFMAGCYAFVCANGRLHIRVFNSTQLYPCYAPNQPIHIRRIVDGWLREGSIQCPSCEDICEADNVRWITLDNTDDADQLTIEESIEKDDEDFSNNKLVVDDKTKRKSGLILSSDVFNNKCLPSLPIESLRGRWIGDPPLDEPCSATSLIFPKNIPKSLQIFHFLFMTVILLYISKTFLLFSLL